jgi:hypothetical protein
MAAKVLSTLVWMRRVPVLETKNVADRMGSVPVSQLGVSGQRVEGAGMDWHLPVFVEFGVADVQQPLSPVEIVTFEAERFTRPHAFSRG